MTLTEIGVVKQGCFGKFGQFVCIVKPAYLKVHAFKTDDKNKESGVNPIPLRFRLIDKNSR